MLVFMSVPVCLCVGEIDYKTKRRYSAEEERILDLRYPTRWTQFLPLASAAVDSRLPVAAAEAE